MKNPNNGNGSNGVVRAAKAAALSGAILAGLVGTSAVTSSAPGPGVAAPRNFPADQPCSIQGDGGDPSLNVQKNRFVAPTADDMTSNVMAPADMIKLLEPHELESFKQRADWPDDSPVQQVKTLETKAVTLEGYLVGAKKENTGNGESCNCHEPKTLFDYHLYVADEPSVGIDEAVVVEMTPRWRDVYSTWGTADNNYEGFGVIKSHVDERVRVTGWLLFDEEHLNQVGKYRATVWEIHPITTFQYQENNGSWTTL
jgi:hypothetical protein